MGQARDRFIERHSELQPYRPVDGKPWFDMNDPRDKARIELDGRGRMIRHYRSLIERSGGGMGAAVHAFLNKIKNDTPVKKGAVKKGAPVVESKAYTEALAGVRREIGCVHLITHHNKAAAAAAAERLSVEKGLKAMTSASSALQSALKRHTKPSPQPVEKASRDTVMDSVNSARQALGQRQQTKPAVNPAPVQAAPERVEVEPVETMTSKPAEIVEQSPILAALADF